MAERRTTIEELSNSMEEVAVKHHQTKRSWYKQKMAAAQQDYEERVLTATPEEVKVLQAKRRKSTVPQLLLLTRAVPRHRMHWSWIDASLQAR